MREHRSGLVGRLQVGLQRQNLAGDRLRRNRFGVGDHILQHGLRLGLPRRGVRHHGLRGGKLRLDLLDGLLAGLRRQVCRYALTERCDLRGRVCAGRRRGEGGVYRERLQLRTDGGFIGLCAILYRDPGIDLGGCRNGRGPTGNIN